MDKPKILLVEDEEGVRELVSATLRGEGAYEVLSAQDGYEALEIARRERPDLVLLDIRLPRVDGFAVCRALKKDPQTRAAHVVMLTVLVQEAELERARKAGADDYITKPFSPLMLLQKVGALLAR